MERDRTTQRIRDFEGRVVRLTPERLRHILEHPEMENMAGTIEETLGAPERVVQSISDPEARLYYRLCRGTVVGDKLLCIVVKVRGDDAFVLTAYLTDAFKKGAVLWPKKL